jgi:hypothetical protein
MVCKHSQPPKDGVTFRISKMLGRQLMTSRDSDFTTATRASIDACHWSVLSRPVILIKNADSLQRLLRTRRTSFLCTEPWFDLLPRSAVGTVAARRRILSDGASGLSPWVPFGCLPFRANAARGHRIPDGRPKENKKSPRPVPSSPLPRPWLCRRPWPHQPSLGWAAGAITYEPSIHFPKP